jgi:hypothetical protein
MTVAITELPVSDAVQRERDLLAGLESKLSDAMARRGKTIQEISRASAEAAASLVNSAAKNGPRKPTNVATIALAPLNRLAKSIDAEIALLRIKISHAQRGLALAEAHAESAKAKMAAERGETAGRLVQLEIAAPDGRRLRQFHKSIDAARATLMSGYEIVGEVIGSGVVSPIGHGARSFMTSLLDAGGGELLEFLEKHGIVGSDKTVVVLPSNGLEKMR